MQLQKMSFRNDMQFSLLKNDRCCRASGLPADCYRPFLTRLYPFSNFKSYETKNLKKILYVMLLYSRWKNDGRCRA